MSWNPIDLLAIFLSPRWACERTYHRKIHREIAKTDFDRQRALGTAPRISPIQATKLIARETAVMRRLYAENPLARGLIDTLVANKIGMGLNVDATEKTARGKPFDRKNKRVNDKWQRWQKGSDLDGLMSFEGEAQRLIQTEMELTGEALVIRDVLDKDVREIPLSIEIVQSERLTPEDRVTDKIPKGNKVVQGVEFNKEGKRVRYHLYKVHPSDSLTNPETTAVEADRVIHYFHREFAGQVRGKSRLGPVAKNFEALNQFLDWWLTKARLSASFAVLLKRQGINPAPGRMLARPSLDQKDTDGNPLSYIEGGTLLEGGPDDSLESASPRVEGADHADFVKIQVRTIAAASGVSYEVLMRDFTGASLSSARMSELEDRRRWMPATQEFRENVCGRVWEWFADVAKVAGAEDFQANRPPSVEWTSTPREYSDKLKEVQADRLLIELGAETRKRVARKNGTRVEDNLTAEGAYQARRRELKIEPVPELMPEGTVSQTIEEEKEPEPPEKPDGDNENEKDDNATEGRRRRPTRPSLASVG